MTIKARGQHYSVISKLVEGFHTTLNIRTPGKESGSIALGIDSHGSDLLLELEDSPTCGLYRADSGVSVVINKKVAALRGTFGENDKLEASVPNFATLKADYSLPKQARR